MTQTGSKRDLPKAYDPSSVEGRIYELWAKRGYFTPQIDNSKDPFVVIMPPPNVTGELHMGHALTTALEDLMVRWHRMRGEPTLYLPGTDHAGIATQVVVERLLASEGLDRHQLGRERFIERVWAWVEEYGDKIYEQLKRLGASCDWTRRTFTLDEGPSRAVATTFVNLYQKGLIYRGERITSWCPRCRTALSDLEVKHQEERANLYYIRYLLKGGGGSVTVATTRPETLLGDTAVAVSPDDDRYRHLIGQTVILPVLKRELPVIADDAVDPEFGTGALKVTPGHDPADFEIGQRHGLPIVNVMNLDATMNENAGPYAGQGRFESRNRIVEELENDQLMAKVEPYHHSVGHCDRCDEVVEPIVTKQWYVRMAPLAGPARDAVADGRIKVIPERFARVYFNWMDNIKDWCISRQLWWGHRIPVWYCQDCDEVTVEIDDPSSCSHCGSTDLRRDPDVLDTWFSSALWTHSTLGWPDETEDLRYFYPTEVMETGYDILFFWVARMIMMGIENVGEVPFDTVYLHGLVLDPEGVKMSKTRGNVLDPLKLINLYGADAVRFALTTGNSPGNNMRLNEQKLEASRNFANKLWNAARFVMANLEGSDGQYSWFRAPEPAHRHDRWIMSRLNRVAGQVERLMEEYQFGEAQRVIHDFLWNEYCDWYIEMAKTRLRRADVIEPPTGGGPAPSPVPVLAYVLERVLRLLHPFMPFITEEIWQTLTEDLPEASGYPDALMIAAPPRPVPSLIDEPMESQMEAVIETVRAIRNLRAEFRIPPSRGLTAFVDGHRFRDILETEALVVHTLARAEILQTPAGQPSRPDNRVTLVLTGGTLTVPLEGLVDVGKEKERLSKELAELDANATRLSIRVSDERFLSKAPEEVVERERQRLEKTEERRNRVKEILARLGEG